MASRDRLPTKAELKKAFNENLTGSIELGTFPNWGSGLDGETLDLLTDIANKYPQTDEALIASAKRSFAEFIR